MMITTQTDSRNVYCIDNDSKYISLIHPIMQNNKDIDFNKRYNKEDVNYYAKKSEYLKNNLFNKGIAIQNTKRITAQSIEDQIINITQILFEVTDACNLKCKYCGYGELYDDYDSRHNQWMSFSKIQPMLQYFVRLWNNNKAKSLKPITISFYGGEPLLNISYIQDIVEYFKHITIPNRVFNFGMTTNAVLLKDNMDFLAQNKFQLLVSLDGNKYNHSYKTNGLYGETSCRFSENY